MNTDVFFGFFLIGIANHPHFGQVNFGFSHTQQFCFDKRIGTETPACSRTVLVAHRGRFKFLYNFEVEFFSGIVLCLFAAVKTIEARQWK